MCKHKEELDLVIWRNMKELKIIVSIEIRWTQEDKYQMFSLGGN